MKKYLFVLVFLCSIVLGFGQNGVITELVSQRIDNTHFKLRLNRLLQTKTIYKEGDIVQISAYFKVGVNGRLDSISINIPIPIIETTIISELKQIQVPRDLIQKFSKYGSDQVFILPIVYQVKNEADILKEMQKEKRRKDREEKRRAKKRNQL